MESCERSKEKEQKEEAKGDGLCRWGNKRAKLNTERSESVCRNRAGKRRRQKVMVKKKKKKVYLLKNCAQE